MMRLDVGDLRELFCPACKRPFSSVKPRRVCAACGRQIAKHHKWRWRDDGRAEHRNCVDPDSYTEQVA